MYSQKIEVFQLICWISGVFDKFKTFADLFEKIQNRPEFKSINISDTKLPELKIDELRQSSIDADVALSTLKSLAVGSFSGVAAGGATIAISGGSVGGLLAGGAAANATLASVGGGAIAAGIMDHPMLHGQPVLKMFRQKHSHMMLRNQSGIQNVVLKFLKSQKTI